MARASNVASRDRGGRVPSPARPAWCQRPGTFEGSRLVVAADDQLSFALGGFSPSGVQLAMGFALGFVFFYGFLLASIHQVSLAVQELVGEGKAPATPRSGTAEAISTPRIKLTASLMWRF